MIDVSYMYSEMNYLLCSLVILIRVNIKSYLSMSKITLFYVGNLTTMSNQEFSVTGLSISRASQGVRKHQQVQGNQKKPVRFQISPASAWTENDLTRRVQLEVTATPLAKQSEQKVQFWSPQESYSAQSAVNQNEEGGDNRQVLHGDENSNVDGEAHSMDVLSSLSGSVLYSRWHNFYAKSMYAVWYFIDIF